MPEDPGRLLRVILRWIQILDDRDPFWHEGGEFRFWSRITSDAAGPAQERRFPSKTTWPISDHPAWNKKRLDKMLFEGMVSGQLVVELYGEEVDPGKTDLLDAYLRVLRGPPETMVGRYGPGADAPGDGRAVDLERMRFWGVCYDIEPA